MNEVLQGAAVLYWGMWLAALIVVLIFELNKGE